MIRDVVYRRFQMETCASFIAVALIAVVCSQYERMLPFDAKITAFYSGYILASGVLGYCFAGWYTVSDTSWFETVSVPIVIALLSSVGASLLWLTLDAIAGRVSNPYAAFLGAMFLAVKLLAMTGLLAIVIGTCASLVLRFRARAVVDRRA
jgi:hypothetical protein